MLQELANNFRPVAPPQIVENAWDMLLHNPDFRGYLARQGVCLRPELEDCYYNSRFLEFVRNDWGARCAEPETFFFNIQGPTPIGGPVHIPDDAVDELAA